MGDELSRLREECSLLRTVAEVAADVVTVLNLDGSVRRAFRTHTRVGGYEPDEVVGRHLLEFVHPEDMAEAVAALAELAKPGSEVCQTIRIRHREGHYLELESTAHNLADDPAVRGIIIHSRDVSARRDLERRLQLSERMESVGRLASGVAHDFNNMLAVIELSVARAEAGLEDSARYLTQIRRAAERGSSLTKRLLAFARERPQVPTPTNVARLVETMADTLFALLPDTVALHVSTSAPEGYALVDAAELEQVVLNLVVNARDALPDGGHIHVDISEEVGDGSEGRVLLTVRDDGIGMDAATCESALRPFFTTKAAGAGTGLGLWTVQEFVQHSSGKFEITSVPGRGTRCLVSLPLTLHRERRCTVPPSSPSSPPAPVTILLAEDEPALRETLAELLRDGGHHVVTARDGEEALAMAAHMNGPIGALVTDVLMPRVGGVELAARLQAVQPGLAVLFVTGYGETGDGGKALPRSRILRKPFAAQLLVDELARLLAE